MVYALGLGDALAGVSHECDFPAAARAKPVVSRPALDLSGLSPNEIDAAIAEKTGRGESIYRIDEQLLRELRPDLILTQDLCHVCAPSGNELGEALRNLELQPDVLFMSPISIAGIEQNVYDLGVATERENESAALVARGRERLAAVAERVAGAPRTRVFVMEWLDPVFAAGHWVPEMVEIAGGVDALARTGADSARVAWDEVVRFAPDVLVIAPCGYHLDRAVGEAARLESMPRLEEIPAVRNGRVYAVDADAYFARPGPRVVDGVELLAQLLHPERCTAALSGRAQVLPFGRA